MQRETGRQPPVDLNHRAPFEYTDMSSDSKDLRLSETLLSHGNVPGAPPKYRIDFSLRVFITKRLFDVQKVKSISPPGLQYLTLGH